MDIPFVKICCISSPHEAATAIAAGASAVGLVSAMPSGPGVINDLLVSEIAASVQAPTATFLLTALQEADAIVAQHQYCATSTIQLVDHVEHDVLRELRDRLPGVRLVQVIHVSGEQSVADANNVAAMVDALLLDSGNQKLEVKELGGTGRTHDWRLSQRICEEVNVPVILAGGIGPSNIVEAIRAVKPFGIDLCSSVRTNDKLDERKLHALFRAVKNS